MWTKLEIVQRGVILKPGDQISFNACLVDEKEKRTVIQPSINPDLRWWAGGGEINAHGDFIAGSEAGKFAVKAAIKIEDKELIDEADFDILPLDLTYRDLRLTGDTSPHASEPPSLRIKTKDVILRPGEKTWLKAVLEKNGDEQILSPTLEQEKLSWDCRKGGEVDKSGTFTAGEKPGKYQVYCSYRHGDAVLGDSVFVQVVPDLVSKKRTAELKPRSAEEIEQATKMNEYRPSVAEKTLATTRRTYRTFGANKDLVWLGLCLLCAVIFGGSATMIIYGVSVEKIVTLLTSFSGFLISLFAKIYTPPGEISQAIVDRILGASPEDKLKDLKEQVKALEEKIKIKADGGEVSFWKRTMDENYVPRRR